MTVHISQSPEKAVEAPPRHVVAVVAMLAAPRSAEHMDEATQTLPPTVGTR